MSEFKRPYDFYALSCDYSDKAKHSMSLKDNNNDFVFPKEIVLLSMLHSYCNLKIADMFNKTLEENGLEYLKSNKDEIVKVYFREYTKEYLSMLLEVFQSRIYEAEKEFSSE